MRYKLVRQTYGDWYIMCTKCYRDVWWKFWKPIPRYHVLSSTFCDCKGGSNGKKNKRDNASCKV